MNNKSYAIITAYRDRDSEGNKLTKKQNIQRNRYLRAKFNDAKIGVYQLVGHWQEAPEGMSYEYAVEHGLLVDVVERSYVVPKPENITIDEFKKFLSECMTIDGLIQDAYILKDTDVRLVYNDGTTDVIGSDVSFNKIAQAYSQYVLNIEMPFVFDSLKQPNGNMDRLAMKRQGLLW